MSTEEPPDPELGASADPDPEAREQVDEAPAGSAPAVGNVLGFALLFRERRALLGLNRRSLATGVRLREYEAVVPGVRLPLRGPLNATKFRNRRCRVVAAKFTVEDRALRPWLRERLVGQEVLGVRIDELELDLRRELPEAERPRPVLMLSGHGRGGGQFWLLVAFDIEPVHRLLVLRPCRLWLVGHLPTRAPDEPAPADHAGVEASIDRQGRDASARRLWAALARRLAAGPVGGVTGALSAGEDGSLQADLGRLAVTRAFASVGWKVPNFEGCAVEELALARRGLNVALRGPVTEGEPGDEYELGEVATPLAEPEASAAAREAVAPVPGEPGLLDEPIGAGLDRARELLRASRLAESSDAGLERPGEGADLGPALEVLAELSRELGQFPAAHLALVRWRVELSRFLDREACLAAVREWLDIQPSAAEARRLLAVLLAAEGRAQELARLLAADCRQPHPPLVQARLELAVASLLIDRLDDPRSALAIVGPLTQRLREQVASVGDRRSGPRAGARARRERSPEQIGLDELLPEALVVLARARVAEVAREGRSLAAVPHVVEALEEALEATRNPRRRADLRAQVADSFAEYGDDYGGDLQALGLLRSAIEDDPEDTALLDRAVELALRADERATAADLLERRLSLSEATQRPSLRKRLIAVAAELDDRHYRELARRELSLALEQEPENPALLRRAAGLERALGHTQAAAEALGRLLELDEIGELHLDDRDLLVLDRARLLGKAGRIDEAWESLRPALARIPSGEVTVEIDEHELPWILDVLELALDLAPPTDRPRILDLLILYARGQRRGEALVERAAQSLRVDERLEDLWLALDELDRPEKILAQIEQLLDDRDHEGLSRLARVAHRLRERTTELHARARLGRALLESGERAAAADELERALELAPDRVDLRVALAQAYERLDRPEDAIPQLHALLEHTDDPSERGELCLRLARLLREIGELEAATDVLARCEGELTRAGAVDEAVREAVAEQSFAALRELAEDDRAMAVALEQAVELWPRGGKLAGLDEGSARRLGAWLARAARILDEAELDEIDEIGELAELLGAGVELPEQLPRTRVALLFRAVSLRPDDFDLAGGLEQVLRELGDREALEAHLRRQVERHADPDRRATMLERLIEVVGADDGRRDDELAELLEDLLVLRPGHTEALLELGELRLASGERTQARQLWHLALERLDEDDPRALDPALELAREALEGGDLDGARELCERAWTHADEDPAAAELLTRIAEALDDPALLARSLSERLRLGPSFDEVLGQDGGGERRARGALELELATALWRWQQREPDEARARAAVEHFAAAERLLPASERRSADASATRRWLALAEELGELEQQARARAVLRESFPDSLEPRELIAEAELLERELDRPLAALERLADALDGRPGDPELRTALEQLLARARERGDAELAGELAQRSARILRGLLRKLEAGEARTRCAELLIELGRDIDDAAAVAYALDQLEPERVETGELAELREWAIRKLGRVDEEVGALESRLVRGELGKARREALVTRLLGLLDDDRPRVAAKLLELCDQAEREVAAGLADAALALLSPALERPDAAADAQLLGLALVGLRTLARNGSVEDLLVRWSPVEGAVRRSDELRPLTQLVELAGATDLAVLGERVDALLAERLPQHPDDARLLGGVWQRAAAEVLLGEGEQGRAAVLERAVSWIEETMAEADPPADPERLGGTLVALAEHLEAAGEAGVDATAAMLRDRAEAHIDAPELFAALLEALHARRRWADLLELLAEAGERGLPLAEDPAAWLRVAEAAADPEHADARAEARARIRAGELLARRAGLELDAEGRADGAEAVDRKLAARALAELRRALELEPDNAALRWRIGLSHIALGELPTAFRDLVTIWDRQQWSAAGVELGELALRCGELATGLGEHERAVELLTAAHARAGEDRREQAAENLFQALLTVDRKAEAVRLAGAHALELDDRERGVYWLRRAAELAEGQRRVELLARARELAPDDGELIDELEAELRAVGDREALEELLRERVDRCRGAARELEEGEALAELADRAPKLHAAWVASLEALIELRRAPTVDVDEALGGAGELPAEDDRAELDALYEELLELAPDHREALMSVAEARRRAGRQGEALALWARAEPQLDDDDPRLFEAARLLAGQALEAGELERAHALLERALGQRPDDLESLERRHHVACALDDPERVLHAAQALLARPAGVDDQRLAELEGDVARAELLRERPLAAYVAYERACELARDAAATELRRELVQRWLELATSPELAAVFEDPEELERLELRARVELRRALGTELERDAALSELDLLIELGELERALEQLERLLIAEPEAPKLRERLGRISELEQGEGGAGERSIRSLRRVVDALEPGSTRDELGRELALRAREAEAARATLDAIDRLSGQAAAEPEMLDLRVWAVRKLDRVGDELQELDEALAGAEPGDPVLLHRLMRVLEHDAEACASRLVELAGREQSASPARVWLLESALDLLHEHAPDRLELGVEALGMLLELLANPEIVVELDADEQAARQRVAAARRHWQQLAASAVNQAGRDRRALETVSALIHVADRSAAADLPGFDELGDMLIDRATVDFPDHAPLHALARQRAASELPLQDPGSALERLERLADAHHMDARGRARLYLGLAATLDDEVHATFLRDLAGYHADEPAIFGPLREALRKRGAFLELVALLESVEAEAEQWVELADDARAAADLDAEGEARVRAGRAFFERVLAAERSGGGLVENSLEHACAQLARARELRPEDLRTQYAYGRALERARRAREALAEFAPLVEQRQHASAEVELGPLARRCGLLALELDEHVQAGAMLHLAYAELDAPRARLAVAERLFRLLQTLTREVEAGERELPAADAEGRSWTEQAAALARDAAALAEAEGEAGDALPWLERAARFAGDERERVELFAQAHALAPDDERLADAYEASLRALDDDARLEALLRSRIASGLGSGDRARTVAQLERLLAMLPAFDLEGKATGETVEDEDLDHDELRERARDRAELLEQLLRLAPERLEPRLELAGLRMFEGDREAAAAHWRMLAERLPSDDRRFLEPARRLADLALEAEDLDTARAWLERALAIEPGASESLSRLLEVARGLDDAELMLATSEVLVERDELEGEARAELLRERARAFERQGDPERALAEVREAAAASEAGSEGHVDAARQWLRLATRVNTSNLFHEEEAREQAEAEVEARAELRRALGEGLPPRAVLAEADLLADRLERSDDAIELLLAGLRLHPGEPDLLAALEERCSAAGEQLRFVRELARLVAELGGQAREDEAEAEAPAVDPDDPLAVAVAADAASEANAPLVRLGEKLARAARAIDDPRTTLDALDALPLAVAERAELLELRDWAVRGLGGVDEELARLEARIRALDPAKVSERLHPLVNRMLRLLGDAGEPCARRLLEIADDPEIGAPRAAALSRAALRVAREYAPEQRGVALEALRATLERDAVKAIAAWWSGLESLTLESGELDALLELLELALTAGAEARRAGIGEGPDYFERATRIRDAAARLDAGDARLHAQLLRRVALELDEQGERDALGPLLEATEDDERRALLDRALDRLAAILDGLATQLELHGAELVSLWSAAVGQLAAQPEAAPEASWLAGDEAREQLAERTAALLRDRARARIDDREAFEGLLSELRERGRLDWVLELALEADDRRGEASTGRLEAIAEQAAERGDGATRARAREQLGLHLLRREDFAKAAESFTDALAGADEPRPDLQYRLGDALAKAGREDAALEQLLPLVERDDLDELCAELRARLGLEPEALDGVALLERCAALLREVEQLGRAGDLLDRALSRAGPADPRREALSRARFELHVALDDHDAAAELAARTAATIDDDPEARVTWLLRAAEHAQDKRRVELLSEAHGLRPGDASIGERLERALEALGDDDRLEALLRSRVEQARARLGDDSLDEADRDAARRRGAEAVRKLIELRHIAELDLGDVSADSLAETTQLWERLLDFVPDDLDAMLELAKLRDRAGDLDGAAELWRAADGQLSDDDERFLRPARRLAEHARSVGDYNHARSLLERALRILPGELEVLEQLHALAVEADDPQLRIRAVEALLEQPDRAGDRAKLLLEAGRAHARLAKEGGTTDEDQLDAAIRAFERATAASEAGGPLHREIVEAWLALVSTGIDPLTGDPSGETASLSEERRAARAAAIERELAARAQLRAALGDALSAADFRLEASLLAVGLGRVDEGLELIEAALFEAPGDALLLSAFKDLCMATGAQERYADVLDRAIAALPEDQGQNRDRLATELAFTAVELEDADRLIAQLERMSAERASSPELLDLREWAIRTLGRVEDELTEIDEELLAAGDDDETAVLVGRLLRMLDQDHDEAGRRLLMLAERAEPAVAGRLRDATLELVRHATPSYFDVLLGALEQLLQEGGEPSGSIAEHWPAIEKLALERDDPGLLAMLIELGQRAADGGLSDLGQRVGQLRDFALTKHPASPELHALVLGPLEVELSAFDQKHRIEHADEALARLAERLQLGGRKQAELWVGFSTLLDRRDAAALLTRRARQVVDQPAEFNALVDALEQDNHWTRALELLELRVGQDEDPTRQVADLKHLAHLCADILGDPDAAIAHLERALEHDPEDPDLMLPLLDHYYAKPQLDRAIELSSRVLELVPMGAVAYAALGHRAADAALATGEHELAEKLLRKILERAPDEARTRDRLRELEQLADDPEHQVRMLAAIANRTAGSARVEALEERARLLVDPLGRLEEAIADLEAVTEESPGRRGAVGLLADLYEQRQRWSALVELLEREYPRQQGLERVLTLRRIAAIQRDRLDAWRAAEKSLRLALENLEGLAVDRFARQLDDHPRLRDELARQLGAGDPELILPDTLTGDDSGPTPPKLEAEAEGADELLELREEQQSQALALLDDQLELELIACLDRRGRFSELIAHLEQELSPDLNGRADPRERYPEARENPRVTLMQRLAKALRDHSEDGERTAQVYARLEQLDALPDEGLATLARWYRGKQRYDDLVRILTVRSRKLAQLGDWDRKSEADFRIGELLEGPLRRPHEAARFFLDAYLANPVDNPAAGARARVLLAGTDSVVNVRNRLLLRLEDLQEDYKPALLTLLADLLAPHDDHEDEAEQRYREALDIDPERAGALEGLGRLLSRQGRLEDAVEPLTKAAASPDVPDDRAADDAASAARALIELERGDEAEAVLKQALHRAPDSQRALLELAKLYDRLDRKDDEATILNRLAGLSLSSMLRAEVGYRQAMLLAEDFREDPMSEAGEKARALLLEAVGADAMHAQARQALLDLASARSEWSIVAHMHFLSIRELPAGPRRALTHLDLAETYLDRLSDAQSSVRNLASALQQAPMDVVVLNRAGVLGARLPDPGDAAQRVEQFSKSPGRPELGEAFTDAARARLMLFASDLHLRNDTLEPAEAAARAALDVAKKASDFPMELFRQAEATLEQIVQIDQGEFDLRKRRKSLHHKLDESEDPVERLQVFSRLRETARALGDKPDLEETTRRQLELAHELLDGEDAPAREAALAALRDVFAESGDYAKVVSLYEDLAGRTGEADEAAELLTSAARFAWSGLRDPKLAVAVVRRALDRSPTHRPATQLLGEIAGASDEREVDETICSELSQLAPRQRQPLLTLRLAEAALRLERREQAQGVLRQLLAGEAPVELRLQALSLLDGLLEGAGRTHDRIPLLEERLELSRRHWPERAADVALQLARAQRAIGNLQDARATCRTTLLDEPSDQPLTKLYAELLEQAEDWIALGRALEQLANLTIETREQAHWLTRAAQVHLDHGDDGRESIAAARRLLERARAVSIESGEARAVLLPLAFHQNDWERVLDLAIELRAIEGDAHEALIYAALTEAFSRGKRTLARSIGDRHERPVRQRVLWPATARMLDLIATAGPLPRLDALLSAAAAMCGGTEELLDELGSWAAGQPLQAGLALGLARLNEAFRRMELARHLYQIAAFMAPAGPVPQLTTRLPTSELPDNPAREDSWVPLEWRGSLREVLYQLRDRLSGIRGKGGGSRPARTQKERQAVQHAARLAGPWRRALGVDFGLAVSEEPMAGGVGVRNLSQPTIVVNEAFVDTPEAERRHRLAYAAASLAIGLGIVSDSRPVSLPDLLDALMSLAKPRHEPATDAARSLVDTLASRGLTASKLDADLRRSLARELDHWRAAPRKLERVLHRSCVLIATRLSGSVDGALMAMARDRGLGGAGDPSVLETSDAAWLLRALGIFGSG